MSRKKNLQAVETPIDLEPDMSPSPPKPIAQQTHRIVTTYKKEIPLEEAETSDLEDDFEEEPATIEPEPPQIETHYPDSISQMLADLQIERRQHTWIMIVERLPNYEKDGRHDVQSKRINCGTRPMSTDFIEDIRREFARPGKPNHFRVTIKRDGKIFAHWPEVISLEPPPPDEIMEYEAKTQPAPIYNFPAPAAAPSFKQMIDQFKQLAELRSVLFPESMQANPAPARPEPLTEEAALMKLLSSNDDVIDRFSKQISKKLFREETADPETSWIVILKSALDNGPGIVRELFNGLAKMRTEAAAPGFVDAPPIAPGGPTMQAAAPSEPAAASINPPEMAPPPPELVLLSNMLRFCDMQTPADAAARWVEEFSTQVPSTNPLIEMFLAMSPADCITFLNQYFPQAGQITSRPYVAEWIANLQQSMTKPETEGEEP